MSETTEQRRERYRRESLERPESAPLIALNCVDHDAARDVYKTMEAVARVGYRKRTGEEPNWEGLNSAQVVDEIIHAINTSRLKQAEAKMFPGDQGSRFG